MILRKRLDELQSAQAGTDKSFLQTDTSKYDSLFGYDRVTNTVSPSSALITSPNKYDSLFGLDRATITTPSTTIPDITVPKTNGTVGEVAKAWGGSIGAGALNLLSTAVGTLERMYAAGTSGDSEGIIKTFSNMESNPLSKETLKDMARIVYNSTPYGTAMNLINPILDKDEKTVMPINKTEGSQLEKPISSTETTVRKWADVENESGVVKFGAGIFESLPSSIATRIPVIGWFLMGNQVYRNTIEQTKAEYAAKGQAMPENLGTLKALGYTGVEVATEMLFPLFGKIGSAAVKGTLGTATQGLVGLAMEKLGIKTAQEVGKLTWKTVGKSILKEAAGEGVEEILSGLGQAGVASLTTNPDDPYFTLWSKDGGLTSLDSLMLQFASGAIMGGAITGVRGTAKMFKNTNDVVDSIGNKPIEEATPEEKQEFKDALVLDMSENENGEQEFITNGVTNFISKVAVTQGQTFKTDTGKLFTVPSNQAVDASKVSPSAIQDVMAIRASRKAQSQVAPTMPSQAVQTVADAIAPTQTENMPTAQANVPNVPVGGSTMNHNTPRYNRGAVVVIDIPVNESRNYRTISQNTPDSVPSKYVKGIVDTSEYIKNGKVNTAIDQFNGMKQDAGTIRYVHWTDPQSANEIVQRGFDLTQYGDLSSSADVLFDNHDQSTQQFISMISSDITAKSAETTQKQATSQPLDTKPHYEKIIDLTGKPKFIERLGRDILLDSMPNFVFFAYKVESASTQPSWKIVEKETGLFITVGKTTLKDAIIKANENIQAKGGYAFSADIQKRLEIIKSTQQQPTTQKQATKDEKKVYTAEQLNTAKAKLLKRLQNPLNDADKGDIQNKIAKIDIMLAKQEKSTLVAESQKQDTSGTQGIVTHQYAKMMKNQPNEPAWKKTISAETKQAIDRASKPNADQSFLTMFKEKLSKLHENVTLGSVPIDVAKGDIRRLFREARAASQYAKGQAENIISKSYNKAGKDKYDLLRHSIIYLDISEDLQAGLYDSGSAMMFNIKSPEEALKTIVAIKAELAKPENTLVREALNTRRKLMDEVRDEVIAEGARAGIDLKHIKAKANYMYHAVTEFRDEFNAALKAKGTRRGNSRVEYMARVGSARDYISDPMMADYLVLQKMQRDLARLRLYNEIKTEDISKTMPYTEEKDWTIKPGYSELDPSMLGIAEYDKFSKQQAKAIASANLQARGIDPHSDTGKRAMAKIMTKYNNHVMIAPTQIVDAVVNEFANKETSSGKMFKKLMNVWKYMKIKMPNAVWKYNTRNLFGDLDPVVSAKPNALLKIPRALKELYAFFYKGGVLTDDLQDYIKRGGVTTGQTPQELKTFNTSKLIKVYDESTKTADVAKKAIRKIWSALTLETATQYREQVMRYATYLSYKSDLTKSETGLPKYYAASIPAEIQGLKDIKDRAYKLANDLVGAYDDVSIAGQWASDHLMPFFRFKEINVKRNYRMIKNAFYNDGFTVKNTAHQATNKLNNIAKASTFTVFRLTKLLLGTAAFYGALSLANGLLAGDDEDELPEDVKNSPHITIPRWITGGEKVYYIDRLGSFAEFMNMFGIDYSMGQDLNDIATGRMQLSDKIKEMVSAPISDAFNSSWPIAKIAFELVTGKTYFPDPKNPSTIRDTWEYIFGQIGFKDEYKAIAGKPLDQGSYLMQKRNILFNSVMPGDAAFYDVYDMVDEYYKSIGESNTFMNYMDKNTDKYKKAQAVYYYKSALKLGDAKAAEKYLAEYVLYGGTQKTLKDSMAYLDPTNALSAKKKADFLAWITPEEKATYDEAMKYYKELSELSSDIAFPTKTK